MPRMISEIESEYESCKKTANTYMGMLRSPSSYSEMQIFMARTGLEVCDKKLYELEQELNEARNASSARTNTSRKPVNQPPKKDRFIELIDKYDETTSEYGFKELINEFRSLSSNIYPEAPRMATECERKYLEAKKKRELEEAERAKIEKERSQIVAREE